MFSYEIDLLKLRILEGLDYVYKFIIIESRFTHQNKEKELYSTKIYDFLKNYEDKIIIHVIDKFPEGIEDYPKGLIDDVENRRRLINEQKIYYTWLYEGYQRSFICNYLSNDKNDLCIVSDLDEIPNYIKIMEDINNNNNNIVNDVIHYVCPTYLYNVHYRQENYNPSAAFTAPVR